MAGEPVYLDTSGILAMLDGDDDCHSMAAPAWRALMDSGADCLATDYVRLECWSLVQRRLGIEAAGALLSEVFPVCEIKVVGEAGFHQLAQQALLLNRRSLSLVDISSFTCMRTAGLRLAFAFDKHFGEQGFITPESSQWPY